MGTKIGLLSRQQKQRSRGRALGAATPYLYILPALLFIGLFIYWPLIQVMYLSVLSWNLISPDREWVGIDNYASLVRAGVLTRLVVQSLQYILIAMLGNFLLPVGLAMLTLQVRSRASDMYQSLLFTPTVVSTAVGALLWQWIYLPSGGLLNELLEAVGLSGVNWLNNPSTALPSVGVVAVWKFLGFNYLIALAGLKAIPRDFLEAAKVDGAVGWQLIFGVVLPLLGPTLLFIALTSALQALPNVFVPIQIMTGGGPSNATTNLVYSVYETGFRLFQIGKASAEAVLTMILLGGLAYWYFRLLDQRTQYDN